MNKHFLISLLFAVLVFVSCKSKKAITTAGEPVLPVNKNMLLVKAIGEKQNTFSYYSASGEMEYKDNEQSQSLGVNIVMEKDQYLYMNITAVLGITVARVFAAPDSLVILDLLHRKAIIANYDYIQKMTGANLRLANLQNLIIGNTLFPNKEGSCTIDSLNNMIQVIQSITQNVSQKTSYTPTLKVSESVISEPAKKHAFTVQYTDVYRDGSNLFPSRFNINIRAEKNMESQLELKTFGFEKKKEVQFSIPKSYERVRL
jgi:hypothetical protein